MAIARLVLTARGTAEARQSWMNAACVEATAFQKAIATATGNQLDACGVCGGDDASCAGCTDDTASNYDPVAIVDDGSCEYNTCIGDLNDDLLVSVADILVMLGTFGCLENCEDDLSSDGTVGVEDLLILLSYFSQDCE